MPERGAALRFEPVPLRLLSLSAKFDAVIWPTLAGMTFTNSTGSKILQRSVNVRTSEDGWVFTLLNGASLTDPADPLLEAATQVMDALSKLRAVGRGLEAAGPADV
ncbi:hypothetical protein JOE58_002575 [Curtobacterium luteum]|uniref:Uncharacterized protein n=1 Tax=Curtobacterium luteum TaxID=33881 RepID=A0A8H9GBS6_9MICO|nr:hypothetical protein [Curtobacterium luteum]MBM7803324.1 hypothetical protein [Curtobacterium luteum]NUU51643.1 hypothetical protein [Curtobacterium luteum]GGL08100.1 hypothetical protein GCM10009769_27880 [Curtobacterium luteum]